MRWDLAALFNERIDLFEQAQDVLSNVVIRRFGFLEFSTDFFHYFVQVSFLHCRSPSSMRFFVQIQDSRRRAPKIT
jgi:hypothetical protein